MNKSTGPQLSHEINNVILRGDFPTTHTLKKKLYIENLYIGHFFGRASCEGDYSEFERVIIRTHFNFRVFNELII